MHYLVCGGAAGRKAAEAAGGRVLAEGDVLALEGPWPLGKTVLAFADSEIEPRAFARGKSDDVKAYAVEGFAAPGEGQAFVIAAHKMRDPDAFRPYAEAIPALLARFGVRSLARGGKVTPLAGDFCPERGVVLEFPNTQSVIDFYTSEVYAPLLALRLRTTDPRFVVLARDGAIPASVRRDAETYLAAHHKVSRRQ